jgi:hypothetical protein
MNPGRAALVLAEPRLDRAEDLRARIDGGDASAWPEYLATIQTLAAVSGRLSSELAGRAMTSTELGERFGLSARTAAKKARAGQLGVTALRLGQRGRGALRWKAGA